MPVSTQPTVKDVKCKVYDLKFSLDTVFSKQFKKVQYNVELLAVEPKERTISAERNCFKVTIIRTLVDAKGNLDFIQTKFNGELKREKDKVPYLVFSDHLPLNEENTVFMNILRWCSPRHKDPPGITFVTYEKLYHPSLLG